MSKSKKIVKPERQMPYYLIALGVVIIASMVLRVVIPYHAVFIGDGHVIFGGNDPWYHMRLAENMAHNFPMPLYYDHFTWFPNGSPIIIPPLMSWLIVIGSFIVSFGQPSTYVIESVGAWLPPILGTLTLIPVYFIGKEMHDKWTGVIAAALVAIMPTSFLTRSMLGFTDHHVLEVLLITTTMLFLIKAYKSKGFLWYILGGLALGLLHLAWQGAIFMLFTMWLWLVVQFVLDNWGGRDVRRFWVGMAMAFGITAIMIVPFYIQVGMPIIYIIAPVLAIVTPGGLYLLARYFKTGKQLCVALGAIVAIALGGLWLAFPVFFYDSFYLFLYAFAITKMRSISETFPLTPLAALHEYGVNFVLFFGGLAVALRKGMRPLLIVIWASVVFIAVSTQCRWDYYFVVAVALMSAYCFTTIGMYFIKEVRKGVSLGLCVALLFLTVYDSIPVAKYPILMSEDWYNALLYLRDNTPEPYADADAYYRLDINKSPEYGVLSWWDYGHWITQVSHRAPVANPFQQGAIEAAEFFVDGKEIEGVRYVIIDKQMVTTKYYAMLLFLGREYTGVVEAPDNSMIKRMIKGEVPDYEVVYSHGDVLIFEKIT